MKPMQPPHALLYEDVVRAALREDLGRAGDLTTDALVPDGSTAAGTIVARHGGTIAGIAVAASAFRLLDSTVEVEAALGDGALVDAGGDIVRVTGPARAILSGERTALNFLGHLSGIATLTAAYVHAVAGSRARIVCTRKTTPGLRALEKYAVRCGGGANHRFGLDDGVLVKDNHVTLAGGVREAVERVRSSIGHMVKLELEVDTLQQLEEGLALGVDAVLLDNMDLATLRAAVEMVAGSCLTEASGRIDLATAADVAATGVDLLSVGALTHSAPTLDVSLELHESTR